MWNVAGVGAALTAAMLAAGGVALATEQPTMPDSQTETNVEVEKQSGTEKKSPSSSHLKGEDARKLQEGLKEQGFYEGKIDGIIGPITKEALMKFQESKGFAATGNLDSQTASALGLEESDVQPVSGKETPEGETSADPVATPMTNSGSESTPDTGLDKTGTEKDALDTQSGDEKSTQDIETKTGDDADKGTTSDADPMEGDLGKDKEPVSGTEDTNKEPLDKEPMSGKEDTNEEPLDKDPIDDKDPVSGTEDEKDATAPADASDNATGTGSSNTGADDGMEPGKHPASHNQPMGGVEGQDDPNVVNDSEIQPQAGTSETFDKKTIKQVEQALKDKKLFKGKVDGVLDENTTNAIRRFQTDNGIVVTGQLDARTLDALGVKTGAKTGVKTNTGGTSPNTGSTPAPDETPVGTPTEPINPPNGNDPIPDPNPGGMTPR